MSNKRQWYAIRSDLERRGLWRYAEASATKKARVGGKKRPAPPPAEDPGEGTSNDQQEPPAKQISEYGQSYKIYSYGKWSGISRGNYRVVAGRKLVNSGQMVCGFHFYSRTHSLFDCDIHEVPDRS